MPAPPARPTGMEPGAEIAAAIDSPLLHAATTLGRAAAEAYNEMPPGVGPNGAGQESTV
jgi:hypothetical protein